MNKRVYTAFNRLEIKKANKETLIPGLLGFMIGGVKTVEVVDRPGYVYVRIRNNTNELVMAFNDQVSPVYDLPVLLFRDEVDKTRYKISGRDVGKYENWGSVSSYLPRHGNQHSFSADSGGGGDIVWVYDRQFAPLLVTPSGTIGGAGVLINIDVLFRNGTWLIAGGTGTASLVGSKPLNTQARMMLVGMNDIGNPWIISGSLFAGTITGTGAILPYLPTSFSGTPLAGIRLVSGTSVILWDNIYDLRQLVNVV